MKKRFLVTSAVAFSLLLTGCSKLLQNYIHFGGSSSNSNSHGLIPISTSTGSQGSESSGSSSQGGNSSSSSQGGGQTTSQTGADDDWTIMLYICGSNLESDYASSNQGLATMDIKEILSVNNKPDSVNIIFETGGCTNWSSKYGISANYLERWHANGTSLVKDDRLQLASMGEASTFESFLEWGMTSYPAKKYGVFLWNHGGAMDGCCFDDLYDGDSLTDYEVESAVANARSNVGVGKLEFIAYDACLMAVQDVAEMNSHHFNYMLCSQETEAGYGYDYDAWLPTLYKNPSSVGTDTLLQKIGQTFLDEEKSLGLYDQTQSVLNLNKMNDYKIAFDNFSTKLTSIITSSSKWSSFASVINQATKYGRYDDTAAQSYNNGYLYDIFDIGECITNLKSSYSTLTSELNALEEAFNNLVVWESHGSQTSGSGLCLFCPISGYNQKTDYSSSQGYWPANYSAEHTNFKTWQSLCAKYGSWFC